jgi:uncharacterized Zn-binding protein involved in type VI secretion
MSGKFIVTKNNPTDKGTVTTVLPCGVKVNGKPVAVIGSQASHPYGSDALVQGVPGISINGFPIAFSGGVTSKGATVLPGTTIEISTASADSSTFTGCEHSPLVEDSGEGPQKTKAVKLTSAYPLQQLFQIAKKDSEVVFIHVLMDIFGTDISFAAYQKLYRDASDENMLMPEIVVVTNPIYGRYAAFDNRKAKIYVNEQFIREAEEDNEKRAMLKLALVEEFGHYLDWRLRKEYKGAVKEDAANDEGAIYVYQLFYFDVLEVDEVHFADVEIDGRKLAFTYEFHELHRQLKQYVEERTKKEDKEGDVEYFGAGMGDGEAGHFGHQSIERDAFKELFKPEQQEKIYFGNWLRDFSQFVDPALVRPLSNMTAAIARSAADNYAAGKPDPWVDTFKSGKSLFSKKGFLDMLDMLFSFNPPEKVENVPIPTDLVVPDGFLDKFQEAKYQLQYKKTVLYPARFSRDAIVSVVRLLAVQEFVAAKYLKNSPVTKNEGERYDKYIQELKKQFGEVTPDRLGVYRPEEHIDNPMALVPSKEAIKQVGANFNYKLNQLMGITSPQKGFVKDPIPGQFEVNAHYAMKNFIRTVKSSAQNNYPFPTAYEYMMQQFRKAAEGNPEDPVILSEFGAGLHVLEDYFAHSNFVEIALAKVWEPTTFPWVEIPGMINLKQGYWKMGPYPQEVEAEEDVKEGLSYKANTRGNPNLSSIPGTNRQWFYRAAIHYPVVTGQFGVLDSIASVLPKATAKLFSIKIEEPTKMKPKERTLNDMLILELLRGLSRSQAADYDKSNNQHRGKEDDVYAKWYISYLEVRDYLNTPLFEATIKKKKIKIPFLEDTIDIEEKKIDPSPKDIFEMVTFKAFSTLISSYLAAAINLPWYLALSTIASLINDYQTAMNETLGKMEKGEYSLGTNPTHTQLAKDDYEHHFHPLAAELATNAVRDVGAIMRDVWNKQATFNQFERKIEEIFCHPVYSSWADQLIIKWVKGKDADGLPNSLRVERGKSPSIVIETTLRSLEEIDALVEEVRLGKAEIIARGYEKDHNLTQVWEVIKKRNENLKKKVKAIAAKYDPSASKAQREQTKQASILDIQPIPQKK